MNNPISPKLKIDFNNGEASVDFPTEWNSLNALLRADILKDLLADFTSAYDQACADMQKGNG